MDRGNYRGLKLTEQARKILERIVVDFIRQVVSIDDSQFGFVPGRGTTDAIFVVRQLQEKYLAGYATRVIFCCSMSVKKVMKLYAFIFEHPTSMVNDYLTIVGYATRVIFCCNMSV